MSSPVSAASSPAPSHSELRVAIVGGGRMARHHAQAVPRAGVGARVVAFAEPDSEARRGFNEICGDAAAYDTLDELLAQTPIDVLHVCTPEGTH